MNLDSFTTSTPDSEFYRVVRHETGHTLGSLTSTCAASAASAKVEPR
jgi:hypothetical protein